jgi:hypothetical protein
MHLFLQTFLTKHLLTYQTNDSGLASYVAGQVDRTLSWKVLFVHPFFLASLFFYLANTFLVADNR